MSDSADRSDALSLATPDASREITVRPVAVPVSDLVRPRPRRRQEELADVDPVVVRDAGADLSAWAPLRNKVFFALFIAQLVSNLGTFMQNVGAAWLMGDLGASSALIAGVQTATFLPVFLVGIPGGALADLFDRRKLLIWTQFSMLASAALMAVLAFADQLSPVGVLALTFMLGTGSALMSPAWNAIQPDLVRKEHFGQAVSLGSLAFNVGRVVGPAVGGLVIAAAGPEWVFVINAVSFLGTSPCCTAGGRRPRSTAAACPGRPSPAPPSRVCGTPSTRR